MKKCTVGVKTKTVELGEGYGTLTVDQQYGNLCSMINHVVYYSIHEWFIHSSSDIFLYYKLSFVKLYRMFFLLFYCLFILRERERERERDQSQIPILMKSNYFCELIMMFIIIIIKSLAFIIVSSHQMSGILLLLIKQPFVMIVFMYVYVCTVS